MFWATRQRKGWSLCEGSTSFPGSFPQLPLMFHWANSASLALRESGAVRVTYSSLILSKPLILFCLEIISNLQSSFKYITKALAPELQRISCQLKPSTPENLMCVSYKQGYCPTNCLTTTQPWTSENYHPYGTTFQSPDAQMFYHLSQVSLTVKVSSLKSHAAFSGHVSLVSAMGTSSLIFL